MKSTSLKKKTTGYKHDIFQNCTLTKFLSFTSFALRSKIKT